MGLHTKSTKWLTGVLPYSTSLFILNVIVWYENGFPVDSTLHHHRTTPITSENTFTPLLRSTCSHNKTIHSFIFPISHILFRWFYLFLFWKKTLRNGYYAHAIEIQPRRTSLCTKLFKCNSLLELRRVCVIKRNITFIEPLHTDSNYRKFRPQSGTGLYTTEKHKINIFSIFSHIFFFQWNIMEDSTTKVEENHLDQ